MITSYIKIPTAGARECDENSPNWPLTERRSNMWNVFVHRLKPFFRFYWFPISRISIIERCLRVIRSGGMFGVTGVYDYFCEWMTGSEYKGGELEKAKVPIVNYTAGSNVVKNFPISLIKLLRYHHMIQCASILHYSLSTKIK